MRTQTSSIHEGARSEDTKRHEGDADSSVRGFVSVSVRGFVAVSACGFVGSMLMLKRSVLKRISALALLLVVAGCGASSGAAQGGGGGTAAQPQLQQPSSPQTAQMVSSGSAVLDRLSAAAVERTSHTVRYDPTYFRIPYPGGDVPAEVGVCTDEVIRSYRAIGVDLQREVHEDMERNFRLYPKSWGLARPDTNIDHRRVPNLMVFFARHGKSLPVTAEAKDYRPGDIVTWNLGGGTPHIGLVVGVPSSADKERLQIVHNIGAGPQLEDVLFNWKITGHYRYEGPAARGQ